MPGPYDIYPAVDQNYAFPPEVRQQIANSAEIKLVLDTNVSAAVAAAKVSPVFTGNPTTTDIADTYGSNDSRIANTKFVYGATQALKDNNRLGGLGQNVSNTDLNNLKTSGFYWGSSLGNSPTSSGSGFIINVNAVDGANVLQFATKYNGTSNLNQTFWRTNNAGGWTAWYQIATLDSPAFTGSATSTNPNPDEYNTRVATQTSVRNIMARFGVGSEASQVFGTDWNNYLTTGFYRGSDYSNGPGGGWFFVTVQRHDDSYVSQLAIGYTNLAMRQFLREKLGGNWTAWREVAQAQGEFDGNANWNDLRNNGTYRGNNAAGGPNGPGGYGWGVLSVMNSGPGQIQLWYPDQNNAVIRTRASWSGGGWSAWRNIRTSPDDFGVSLINGGGGSVNGTREGRTVTLGMQIYCGSGFGTNGVGTVMNVPDGARPAYQGVEIPFRTSDGYTVWGDLNQNGNLDWRAGGTGSGGGVVSPGNWIYGMVTYAAQY